MRTRRTSPLGTGESDSPSPLPDTEESAPPPHGGPPTTPPPRPKQHRVGGRTIEAGAPCRRIRNKKEKPSVAERQKGRVRGRTTGAGVASGTRSRGSPRAPAPMLRLPAALRRSRTGVPFRTLVPAPRRRPSGATPMIANPVPPPPSPFENRFVKRPVQVKKK